MIKTRLSKKGFVASGLTDMYAYVGFVLIIIIFFILYHLSSAQNTGNTQGSQNMVMGGYYLASLLSEQETINSPNFKGKIVFNELLVLSLYDTSLRSLVQERAQKHLNEILLLADDAQLGVPLCGEISIAYTLNNVPHYAKITKGPDKRNKICDTMSESSSTKIIVSDKDFIIISYAVRHTKGATNV